MTIIVFILGLLIILGIARYNESNKLFWILFVSYVLGFAGVKMLLDVFGEKEQSEVSLNQAYPIQGLATMDNAFVCEVTNICSPTTKTMSKPVGQAYTPDFVEKTITLSDVHGVTHGLYLHNLANPPNDVLVYDTS